MAHFDLLDEIFNIFLSQNNFLCKNGRFFIIIFIASILASIYSMLPGKFRVLRVEKIKGTSDRWEKSESRSGLEIRFFLSIKIYNVIDNLVY